MKRKSLPKKNLPSTEEPEALSEAELEARRAEEAEIRESGMGEEPIVE